MEKSNIAVVGIGYVGLSIATLLAKNNRVIAVDIDDNKIKMVNERVSPINDDDITFAFQNLKLNLLATNDSKEAFKSADLVVIATPTNYDERRNYFDTTSIENVLENVLKVNKYVPIIIKSTVPVGYTDNLKLKFKKNNITFSPEFLREGKALYDNLYPSRIIVGSEDNYALDFAKMLSDAALIDQVPVLSMSNTEAEAVKLFSNTYLAMRVSYFNELDTYAELRNLDPTNIIKGVSFDPRIGGQYNNPSFGYGGYCLPKDTKQLLSNFKGIPQNLISAIVESNDTRKNHISKMINSKNPKIVGIYRLTMKTDSDNFRDSAIFGIMSRLNEKGVQILIYEPTIKENEFEGYRVENNIDTFKDISDLIVANRISAELSDSKAKVYTRDIFGEN